MSRKILITAGEVQCPAELNDTDCAAAIYGALPVEASVNTWGEEIYFSIGLTCPLGEDAREEMAVGELGYWPPGKALCIFFGRTPASGPDGRPRAASAVDPVGQLLGPAEPLKSVRDGETIRVSAAE